jgi:hypothetical protein
MVSDSKFIFHSTLSSMEGYIYSKKLRIFRSNVKSVLLYGCKCGRLERESQGTMNIYEWVPLENVWDLLA